MTLEAELLDGDDDAYAVYADLLASRGDPRGELIALSLAHARHPDPVVAARIAELHAAHDDVWLGALRGPACTWERGFVARVAISPRYFADLRALPALALVRDVALVLAHPGDDFASALAAIDELGLPAGLVALRFDHGAATLSDSSLDATPVYARAAALRELELAVGHLTLGRIELPELRSFDVWTGGLSRANMRSIVGARWPRLERLALRFGDPDEELGAECTLDDVLPLLASPPPHLVHLALANATFTDELIPHLARSPVLPRLRTLDLSLGTLGDEGAAALLDDAEAFAHLAWIDTSSTFVDAMAIELAERLPIRTTGYEDPRYGRYCMIGEGYAASQRFPRFDDQEE